MVRRPLPPAAITGVSSPQTLGQRPGGHPNLATGTRPALPTSEVVCSPPRTASRSTSPPGRLAAPGHVVTALGGRLNAPRARGPGSLANVRSVTLRLLGRDDLAAEAKQHATSPRQPWPARWPSRSATPIQWLRAPQPRTESTPEPAVEFCSRSQPGGRVGRRRRT
jgi:hypothetical protein